MADYYIDQMTSGRMPVGSIRSREAITMGETHYSKKPPSKGAVIHDGWWYQDGVRIRQATLKEIIEHGYGTTGEVTALPKLNKKERVDMTQVMVNGEVKQYIAVVQFLHSLGGLNNTHKEYDFFCNIPLQDRDVVVVDTVNGLQLAKVVGIKKTSRAATKWVVDKVDLSAHKARVYVKSRASQILERLEAGDFDVQPLDKRYTLKVAWAFNDRVV